MNSMIESPTAVDAIAATPESPDSAIAKLRPDRRQNILDASQRLFARYGYHAVTIRQIAAEAKVPLALVGYYFGQKQELYDAIFAHWGGTVAQRSVDLREALLATKGERSIIDAQRRSRKTVSITCKGHRRGAVGEIIPANLSRFR